MVVLQTQNESRNGRDALVLQLTCARPAQGVWRVLDKTTGMPRLSVLTGYDQPRSSSGGRYPRKLTACDARQLQSMVGCRASAPP
eukprot:SAG31_NODE_1256_length_9081_cov_13.160655_3_plen_85_part_00